MTEDILSQLANPKKFAFVEEKKEEKVAEKPQVQSVLPTEPVKQIEQKPVAEKKVENYDKQLADVKKVEDIFKSIINRDKSRR